MNRTDRNILVDFNGVSTVIRKAVSDNPVIPHRQSAESYSPNLGGTTDNKCSSQAVIVLLLGTFLLYSVKLKFGGLSHGKAL